MSRRIITAREQVEMLSPWRVTASQDDWVDPSKEEIPDTGNHYYHATNHWNLADIQDRGSLITHTPSYGTEQSTWPDGTTEKRSYWTHDPQTAHLFYPEGGRPTLLRAPRNVADFKRESTGDTYLRKAIPAKHLEVYTGNGKWAPLSEGNLNGY